ncbi:unnamed protein product [Rotaria sp. Silwood2]|nr:unnamed protein product [Rotaria sp. Silwood2]
MVANVYANELKARIISARSTFDKTQDVVVKLEYSNTGAQTIQIHNWCLPSNELYDPLFTVTCNDVPVEYLGPIIKRREPTIDDVIPVAPGKTISTIVRLSSVYDMTQTCNYSIQYNMPIEHVIFRHTQTLKTLPGKPISKLQSHIQSNNIRLAVEGRSNIKHRQNNIMTVRKRAATLNYVGCSENATADIIKAVSSALIYANNAFNYLNNTTPSGTKRYKTWFGTLDWMNWNTVMEHYQNLTDVFNSENMTFDCTCNVSNYYAYVYSNQPYNIYLCPVFWKARMTGTDSKAGTLIHETSHFTVVAGTSDYAYGQTACKSLAITNATQAIMNADSHEYFAENSPLLP